MPQPTLHTERIVLVPLAEEHPEFEVELDSNRLIAEEGVFGV